MKRSRQSARSAAILVIITLASMCLVLSGQEAWSQTAHTTKIVVPFPAGGPSDTPARLLAEQISRAQGLTMIVENRPGANGTIGIEAVARAVPDGSTLLIATTTFVINPHLRKVGYDPLASFDPICNLTSSPTIIAVSSSSPYRSLADLLDAARAKPGVLTMAGVGPASTVHIAFEMLKRAANINMTFIPYASANLAVNALLGEHVTSVFGPYPGAAEQLKSGKLRALATPSRTRIEALPDVPTVVESGYTISEMDVWFGLVAPTKTPKASLTRVAGWFTAALNEPEVRAKLVAQGLYPVGMCGADFGAFLRKQYGEYGSAIHAANIKAE